MDAGNAANDETVNVPIQPSTAADVPLRSVAGWLIILSRIDAASFPMELPLADYRDGFGDIADNFWIGLDRLHSLTACRNNGGTVYRLRVELQLAGTYR